MEDLKEQHWTIDKRISLGHVYSFAALMLTGVIWLVGLQFQINGNSASIKTLEKTIQQMREDHNRDMARLESKDGIQYAEIIRRLELLQTQLNEAIRNK